MIFYQIYFGQYIEDKYEEAELLIENYLATLFSNNQIANDYNILSWKNEVVAYACARGTDAHLLKYHSKWGKERLHEIKKIFGQSPVWRCNDDGSLKKTCWKGAPFLYIATTYDGENLSVLIRGDNGDPIPLYRVPISDQDREDIKHWKWRYEVLDGTWIATGDLEVPAYRAIAEPTSQISERGRECCLAIEKATGIPTYYYLFRFYGRQDAAEKKRRCPGCGKPWFVKRPKKESGEGKLPWEFDFMCEKCRLVSHCACKVNLRWTSERRPAIPMSHVFGTMPGVPINQTDRAVGRKTRR